MPSATSTRIAARVTAPGTTMRTTASVVQSVGAEGKTPGYALAGC